MSVLIALSLVALTKTVLVTALAVLNGALALLATLSLWKTYLVVGTKVALTLLVFVPVVGVVWYLGWGQRIVRDNR